MKISLKIASMLSVLLLAFGQVASAQSTKTQSIDSVVYRQASAMDSTLIGKSIFSLLPSSDKGGASGVTVHQSAAILKAFNSHVASNRDRKMNGYRVRIFSDNKQNSRGASEAALARFKGMFPGCSAYRTYSNPFFKVTVGDFRTKSEAMKMLQQLKGSFPSAFIVAEQINYPVVDRNHAYTIETVKSE